MVYPSLYIHAPLRRETQESVEKANVIKQMEYHNMIRGGHYGIKIANGTVVIDQMNANLTCVGRKNLGNRKNHRDLIVLYARMYVLPGMIDAHTHMELQQSEKYRSVDDFYTGTAAAQWAGRRLHRPYRIWSSGV